jgi:hypothetical protein
MTTMLSSLFIGNYMKIRSYTISFSSFTGTADVYICNGQHIITIKNPEVHSVFKSFLRLTSDLIAAKALLEDGLIFEADEIALYKMFKKLEAQIKSIIEYYPDYFEFNTEIDDIREYYWGLCED